MPDPIPTYLPLSISQIARISHLLALSKPLESHTSDELVAAIEARMKSAGLSLSSGESGITGADDAVIVMADGTTMINAAALDATQVRRLLAAMGDAADRAISVPQLVQLIETRLLAAKEVETHLSLAMGHTPALESADDRAEREAGEIARQMNKADRITGRERVDAPAGETADDRAEREAANFARRLNTKK